MSPADIDYETVLKKLRRITVSLDGTVRAAIRSRAFLETANQDLSLRQSFNGTYEANAFNAIRHVFINDLVLAIARCWDAPGKDRASLPTLSRQLDAAALKVLVEAAAEWNPGMDLAPKNQETIRRDFPKLKEMIDAQSRDENGERKARIRNFRDIYLARDLTLDPANLPQFRDVFDLLDDTIRIMEIGNLIICGLSVDYNARDAIDRKLASAFWRITRIGMEDKDVATPMMGRGAGP